MYSSVCNPGQQDWRIYAPPLDIQKRLIYGRRSNKVLPYFAAATISIHFQARAQSVPFNGSSSSLLNGTFSKSICKWSSITPIQPISMLNIVKHHYWWFLGERQCPLYLRTRQEKKHTQYRVERPLWGFPISSASDEAFPLRKICVAWDARMETKRWLLFGMHAKVNSIRLRVWKLIYYFIFVCIAVAVKPKAPTNYE